MHLIAASLSYLLSVTSTTYSGTGNWDAYLANATAQFMNLPPMVLRSGDLGVASLGHFMGFCHVVSGVSVFRFASSRTTFFELEIFYSTTAVYLSTQLLTSHNPWCPRLHSFCATWSCLAVSHECYILSTSLLKWSSLWHEHIAPADYWFWSPFLPFRLPVCLSLGSSLLLL